jgi:hypothetical protein
MTVSLRLSKAEDSALTRAAARAGVSKSEFLRQCLAARLNAEPRKGTAYELGKDLFGGDPSGRKDLVTDSRRIVREKTHAKTRRS